jgi:hypothetical protein
MDEKMLWMNWDIPAPPADDVNDYDIDHYKQEDGAVVIESEMRRYVCEPHHHSISTPSMRLSASACYPRLRAWPRTVV